MKRAILRLPQGTRFDTLPEEQRAAIESVWAQFTLPMPGTVAANGHELADSLAGDNFDPSVMPALGMNWPVVGLWQWGGRGELITLVPLDTTVLLAHLPPHREYDDEGNVISETAQTEAILPCNWSGWPEPT